MHITLNRIEEYGNSFKKPYSNNHENIQLNSFAVDQVFVRLVVGLVCFPGTGFEYVKNKIVFAHPAFFTIKRYCNIKLKFARFEVTNIYFAKSNKTRLDIKMVMFMHFTLESQLSF